MNVPQKEPIGAEITSPGAIPIARKAGTAPSRTLPMAIS